MIIFLKLLFIYVLCPGLIVVAVCGASISLEFYEGCCKARSIKPHYRGYFFLGLGEETQRYLFYGLPDEWKRRFPELVKTRKKAIIVSVASLFYFVFFCVVYLIVF